MSRAPRWRVRGGKAKEEEKEGWVLVGKPGLECPGSSLWILPTCRNEWIRGGFPSLYFRDVRGVKAIREDCPPGKEEGKKVLSSISTSFPRPWKSRPAQRMTLALGALPKDKKSSLTISHSLPAEPPLFPIRCLRLPFL